MQMRLNKDRVYGDGYIPARGRFSVVHVSACPLCNGNAGVRCAGIHGFVGVAVGRLRVGVCWEACELGGLGVGRSVKLWGCHGCVFLKRGPVLILAHSIERRSQACVHWQVPIRPIRLG